MSIDARQEIKDELLKAEEEYLKPHSNEGSRMYFVGLVQGLRFAFERLPKDDKPMSSIDRVRFCTHPDGMVTEGYSGGFGGTGSFLHCSKCGAQWR